MTTRAAYTKIATAARSAQVLAQEAEAWAEDIEDEAMRRSLAGDVFSLRTTHDLAREKAAELAAMEPSQAPNPPRHRRRA